MARSVRDVRTMLVVAAYLVGFVLHATAIWLLPLYLAQALVAMSLPVTALASHRVEDALQRTGWLAVGVVTLGLVLLSLGAGDAGRGPDDHALRGRAVDRRRRPRAGVHRRPPPGRARSSGCSPVSGTPAPPSRSGASARRSTASSSSPRWPSRAFGLVAFWLYSLGMHRAAVPSTTASLIVAQTFVPAAVGVALLGDGVRDGWWPAVTVGLVLSTAGAVVLGRQKSRVAGEALNDASR